MTQEHPYGELLAEAERYCAAAGIKLSTLGLYAVGSSRWFADRKAGKPCLTTTMTRVRAYMDDNPPVTKRSQASRRAP